MRYKGIFITLFISCFLLLNTVYSKNLEYKKYLNYQIPMNIIQFNSNFDKAIQNNNFEYISNIYFLEYIYLDMSYISDFAGELYPLITNEVTNENDLKKLKLVNEKLKDITTYFRDIKVGYTDRLNHGYEFIDSIQKDDFLKNTYEKIISILKT
ncbi:MAG: hypothetical protein ACRDDL_06650 [Sarcina sp.]